MSDDLNLKPDGPNTVADIGLVYGAGCFMNIEVKDLLGNEIGIRQLMNAHNDQAMRRADAERRLADKEGEVEFLKTSPFIAIVALAVLICGSVVIGIGVNMATSKPAQDYAALVICLGGALSLVSGLSNILYPYARKWFNRQTKPTLP
jgi:hypothetical protein